MRNIKYPQPVRVTLPEYVAVCDLCQGHGYYKQHYCDAPSMHGDCDMCKGMQFVYAHSGAPVPQSVVEQIRVANQGLDRRNAMNKLAPEPWSDDFGHMFRCYDDIPPLFVGAA